VKVDDSYLHDVVKQLSVQQLTTLRQRALNELGRRLNDAIDDQNEAGQRKRLIDAAIEAVLNDRPLEGS
jgi:hypothetical protein